MIKKAQEAQAAYEAAKGAVEKSRPEEIELFNDMMLNWRKAKSANSYVTDSEYDGAVCVKFDPHSSVIRVSVIGKRCDNIAVDPAALPELIKGLTLLQEGRFGDLTEGWYHA